MPYRSDEYLGEVRPRSGRHRERRGDARVKLFLRTDDCNVGDAYGYFKLTHLMRDALIAEGVQVTANTGDSFDIVCTFQGRTTGGTLTARKTFCLR